MECDQRLAADSHKLFPLKLVCRAISENPVVPTDEQLQVFRKQWDSENWNRSQENRGDFFRWCLLEWQRRMFLAPEPEVPEEISNLMWKDWLQDSVDWANPRMGNA